MRFEARKLLVDFVGDGDALHRIHSTEGQHDLECVHGQLGGLEAIAEAANIQDAVLHTLKDIEYLHDGTRIAFDVFDRVFGPGLNGLLKFRLEKILHQAGVDDRRRMP